MRPMQPRTQRLYDTRMARSDGEIFKGLHLIHIHCFRTNVFPAPASKAMTDGNYPYKLCGCGETRELEDRARWFVNEKGDWEYDDAMYGLP